MTTLRVGNGAAVVAVPAGDVATVAYASLLVKDSGAGDECEDRIAWTFDDTTGTLRAAVSDGASASLRAGEWAELLAVGYCAAPTDDAFRAGIGEFALRWRRQMDARPLPWYEQAKAARGAFAALVGLTVRADGGWSALAMGDTCIFQVRAGGLIAAHPIGRADDFGRNPILIGTNGDDIDSLVACYSGSWLSGDHLYLMTDALAAWALAEIASDRSPWSWLRALESTEIPRTFDACIDDLRRSGRLQNDDVALLHLRLGAHAG